MGYVTIGAPLLSLCLWIEIRKLFSEVGDPCSDIRTYFLECVYQSQSHLYVIVLREGGGQALRV